MGSPIARFLADERGLETVEWAIVGGVVVAIGAALLSQIGTDSSTALNNLQSQTAAAS